LPNQSAVANGLSALRSHVAVIRERIVRSTAATEAVAEHRSQISALSFADGSEAQQPPRTGKLLP